MRLNFGVVDIPYANVPKEFKKHERKSGSAGVATTGRVAEILEANYGLMEDFFKTHKPQIIAELEAITKKQVDALLRGDPPPNSLFAEAESNIEAMFRQLLAARGFDFQIAGVPTKAAEDGVSHRFANPNFIVRKNKKGKVTSRSRRPPRPSFVDTGLFSAAFKVWIEAE